MRSGLRVPYVITVVSGYDTCPYARSAVLRVEPETSTATSTRSAIITKGVGNTSPGDIEAKVIVWQVSGPLPWGGRTTDGNPSSQGREMGGGVRLQERLLSSIHDLLMVVEMKLRVRIGKA
jgi:hypothetical protein